MKKSIKLTMILLSGITVFDSALGQNLCVNSRGDTKVASRCPSGYRAVLNLRSTVTEQKLANTPLVTSGSIRPEAVIGSIHIAPKSILGAQIGDKVIEARHIAKIPASLIEGLPSFELQPGSVNTEHLRDNAVTSRKIAAEAVGDREVSSISHLKVRWDGWTLPPNTVGEDQIRREAITSEKIKNETIKNEDIAPNARIAFSKIALPQGGIPGSSIAANSIGDREVSSISHEKVRWTGWTLPPNTVGERQLLSEAVTSEKIKNETIKNEDIAPNAQIAFSKIALPQGGIPGSSIAAGSIGAAQLAPNSVDHTKIVAGAVTNVHLNLSISTPPFFGFYNLINLPAITAPRNSGITLTRFYSYSNQSLSNGYDSFYANTGSEFPRYLITTNGALFGCKRFFLSVQSLTPVGSGYRDFSLVASGRWGDANLSTLKTDNGQDAIVRVSDASSQGSIEGSFKDSRGQEFTPWWVALRVYSVANQGQSLPASSAEVRVTCK